MPLPADTLNWQDIVIGGEGTYLEEGVEGFGHPSLNTPSTQRSTGGTWGGLWVPQDQAYSVNLWLDADLDDIRDWSGYKALRSSMRNRPHPTDELPLSWSGMLGDEELCAFVRPTRFVPIADEDGVHGGSPGIDMQWVASDPVIYDIDQTTAALWPSDEPVSSASFEAANSGDLVEHARRAVDFRMTARGGPVVNPWMRFTHDDGTFEQVTFQGTLGSGLTLTVGADRLPRIGSTIVSSRVRSLTELGIVSNAPRWWLLHHSNGSDGANEVTVGATSGTFSGYVKTRGTR